MKPYELLLIAGMILALTGCGKSGIANPSEAVTVPETMIETLSATGASAQLELPILQEISDTVAVGTSDSYMTAVQAAAAMLDWGVHTGLNPEEIRQAAVDWLTPRGNDAQAAFAEKLTQVDSAYQELLKPGAEALLSSAGLEDAGYPWSDTPVASIEAIMEAAGLR